MTHPALRDPDNEHRESHAGEVRYYRTPRRRRHMLDLSAAVVRAEKAEALAVARGVIMGYQDVISLPDVDRALAALALIEREVDRRSGLDVSQEVVDQLKARAEKAEAERDEARRRFSLEELERLERRVAELEAALREILMTDGLGGASEVMRDIARRALGGGRPA